MLHAACGITNDLLAHESFPLLISAISDYYLSDFLNVDGLADDFTGAEADPRIRKIAELFKRLNGESMANAALVKVSTVMQSIATEMKKKNDEIEAEYRGSPDAVRRFKIALDLSRGDLVMRRHRQR